MLKVQPLAEAAAASPAAAPAEAAKGYAALGADVGSPLGAAVGAQEGEGQGVGGRLEAAHDKGPDLTRQLASRQWAARRGVGHALEGRTHGAGRG